MKATIGVYDTHELAVQAIKELKDAGYSVDHLSIIGKGADSEAIDKEMHTMPKNPLNPKGIGTATVVGTTVGLLTGVGLFAIPGLGFLYGAGALVGAIAGFDFGLIGGGIASFLATIGVEDEATKKYQKDLDAGKFLIIAQGTDEEVSHAREVLHSHGMHEGLGIH